MSTVYQLKHGSEWVTQCPFPASKIEALRALVGADREGKAWRVVDITAASRTRKRVTKAAPKKAAESPERTNG